MKSNISEKKLREFGVLIGFGFPILVGWLLPSINGHLFRFWTLWFGLSALFLGILKPSLLFYPYKVWIKVGHVLGWVNSRIILGLIFLIVLLPIAFIMRSFGYDPLRTKTGNEKSYREKKDKIKINLLRIF